MPAHVEELAMCRVVISAQLLPRAVRRCAWQLVEKVAEAAAPVFPLIVELWCARLTQCNELHAIRAGECVQVGAFDREKHLLRARDRQG